VFGLITLGLGWLLFWLVCAGLGDLGVGLLRRIARRRHSLPMGCRVMDLELRTWYGAPSYFVLGAMHACCSGCRYHS